MNWGIGWRRGLRLSERDHVGFRSCGLSSRQGRRGRSSPRSSASRSRAIGAACGTTPGAPGSTSTASRSTAACTVISGRTARRNAWNSPTTPSTGISSSRSRPIPPREVLYDYITGRAKKSGVRKQIRFSTAVRFVEFSNKTGKFKVTVEDLPTRATSSENFDYVIVATGHFSVPNVPHFEGVEKFPGRVMHAPRFPRRAGIRRQDACSSSAPAIRPRTSRSSATNTERSTSRCAGAPSRWASIGRRGWTSGRC